MSGSNSTTTTVAQTTTTTTQELTSESMIEFLSTGLNIVDNIVYGLVPSPSGSEMRKKINNYYKMTQNI